MVDDGDLDHNGIPDAIQRDPVWATPDGPYAEPGLPGLQADGGLPGSSAPLDAGQTGVAPDAPVAPGPPTPPPADADAATMQRYQAESQQFQLLMDAYSQVLKSMGESMNEAARRS